MAVTFTSKNDGGMLTVYADGKIDSFCAADAEAELKTITAESGCADIVLDAEKLEYISSAGLRIVLRMKKDHPTFKIVNVQPDVYDVFEMTGFTEMMEIEKAYRVISIEGCECIGEGANGLVYRIDGDNIIKVYRNPDCLPDIQRERELARKAFVAGIPTAISYDVARVGDSYGSVFELLDSKSFAKLIAAHPEDIDKYISLSVKLLKTIHSTEMKPGELPDMRETVIKWVEFTEKYLPAEAYAKLIKMTKDIPQDNHMIHGDYHIKNIMLQGDEPLLIDMDTIAVGNPVIEFASIYNAYVAFLENDHDMAKRFLGIEYSDAEKMWKGTLREYFETDDGETLKNIENKAAIIGYVRILRRSVRRGALDTEEGRKAVQFYADRITALVGEVDKLTF